MQRIVRQRTGFDIGDLELAAEDRSEGKGSRDRERRELSAAFSTTRVPPGSGGLSESSGASSSLGRLAREPLTSRTRSDVAGAKVAFVEQTRGQRHTGRNDLPGRVRELLSGW